MSCCWFFVALSQENGMRSHCASCCLLLTSPCSSGAEWLYAGWEGEVYPNASSSSHPLMSSVTINCENGCLFDVVAGETPLSFFVAQHCPSLLVRCFTQITPDYCVYCLLDVL